MSFNNPASLFYYWFMTSLDSSPLSEGFLQWISYSNWLIIGLWRPSILPLFWRGSRNGCQIQICQLLVYDVPRFFTSFGGVPAMDVRFKFVMISDFGMFFLFCSCSLCSFHPFHTDILSSIYSSIFQAFFQAIQQAILQAFFYSFCDEMFFGLFTLFVLILMFCS